MAYFEYQDEVQEKLQDLVDDYYEGKEAKDEGELKQFVTEKIIDIALDYSTDRSEEIFEKAFGKEAVKKSRIPVSTIREVYDGLDTISDAADIGSDIADLIDAAGDLNFGNMSNTSVEYQEAMKKLTSSMLSLTDTLVQKIPICGPMASMIVNELDQCFEKGYDIITNHIAQLKYVDAMCDYYTGAISTSDLVDKLSDIKGIDPQELQQYRILANIEEKLAKNGYKADHKSSSDWDSIGHDVYDDMSSDEKKDYGDDDKWSDGGKDGKNGKGKDGDGDWQGDTTDKGKKRQRH